MSARNRGIYNANLISRVAANRNLVAEQQLDLALRTTRNDHEPRLHRIALPVTSVADLSRLELNSAWPSNQIAPWKYPPGYFLSPSSAVSGLRLARRAIVTYCKFRLVAAAKRGRRVETGLARCLRIVKRSRKAQKATAEGLGKLTNPVWVPL